MEQLTLLTFLAGITSNIRLVPSVMIVPYRNPLLTAKMLAIIDVLSKGRLTLGVGAGWRGSRLLDGGEIRGHESAFIRPRK